MSSEGGEQAGRPRLDRPNRRANRDEAARRRKAHAKFRRQARVVARKLEAGVIGRAGGREFAVLPELAIEVAVELP
jgi:hypothetical protein